MQTAYRRSVHVRMQPLGRGVHTVALLYTLHSSFQFVQPISLRQRALVFVANSQKPSSQIE